MSEDKVASFDWLVTREAGLELSLVGWFAVFIKLSKPRAANICGMSVLSLFLGFQR
jgi:hypothetical protein